MSPDGKWMAFIDNYNVAIRPFGGDKRMALSTDGSEGNYYDGASIAWSPDSTKVAAYRVRPGYRRLVHYVASSPEDQLQPEHWATQYAKPGDLLDLEQPVLFDVRSQKQIAIDSRAVPESVRHVRSGVAQGQPRASASNTTSAATRCIASSKSTRRPAPRAR